MNAVDPFVVVGAGQAGFQAVATLKERGCNGPIVLIGEESDPPYMRPPLSKKLLAGELDAGRAFLRPSAFYAEAGVDTRFGLRVESIDRARARVTLANGERIPYQKLLLATGCRPRTLDEAPGGAIHYLRTLEDALALRSVLAPGKRLAIIGGGYIGMEVAATAAALGVKVTVLELAQRILARVTSARVAEFFTGIHRARGVDLRCATSLVAVDAGARATRIVCADPGDSIDADAVLVAVGVTPNVELAHAAGLACNDGIVVDEQCRTSDPAIFAAGDCTRHPNPAMGGEIRLESVQNAVDQSIAAARNMAGDDAPYRKVPWFWSQQYEFRLQTAGIRGELDEVEERGGIAEGRFAMIYRRSGTVTACDAVNMPGEYVAVRRELEARERTQPSIAPLARARRAAA